MAWAGPVPLKATGSTGKPLDLDIEPGRRDGSGVKLAVPITALGGPVRTDEVPDGVQDGVPEGVGGGEDGDRLPLE